MLKNIAKFKNNNKNKFRYIGNKNNSCYNYQWNGKFKKNGKLYYKKSRNNSNCNLNIKTAINININNNNKININNNNNNQNRKRYNVAKENVRSGNDVCRYRRYQHRHRYRHRHLNDTVDVYRCHRPRSIERHRAYRRPLTVTQFN